MLFIYFFPFFKIVPCNFTKNLFYVPISLSYLLIVDEHFELKDHINKTIKESYATLRTLKKLKRFTSFTTRKQLAESLLLSKLDYCNALFLNLPAYTKNQMQRVQNSIAGFVYNKYANINDVINLKWLPVSERIEFSISKIAHKWLHQENYPSYSNLKLNESNRTLRSNAEISIQFSKGDSTFTEEAANVFNQLPTNIKKNEIFREFSIKVKIFLLDKAIARNIS